jgi:hypothetical protein
MIGLDGVIGVLLHDVTRAWQHLVKYADVGRCPVRVYLGRICTVFESMGEEPAGGDQIPFRRGQHVDDLAELVERTVQIDSLPGDLDIGFIDEPAIASISSGVNRCTHR